MATINPAIMPEILADILLQGSSQKKDRPEPDQGQTTGTSSRYALAALDDESAKVRTAPKGSRNATLNTAAFSIGQLVGGGQISRTMAESALLDAAIGAGLDRKEARATIASGFNAGQAEPRTAPEPDQAEPETGNDDTATKSTSFDFLNIAALIKNPVATAWLVYGLIIRNCLASLFADAGELKSFFAIALGLAIATGIKFLDAFHVSMTGPVFYIAGEGFHGIPLRLRAWLISHGITNPETIPFFVSRGAAGFLDQHSAESVHDAVDRLSQQYGNPVLIIVDTLSRNFGPGDENSTADMTAFVSAMDALKTKFNCAVLLVHHSGLADKNRGRGSSVLRAALDFEYKIERIQGGDVRTLSCTKAKDCEPPAPFSFIPRPVFLDWQDPETGDDLFSLILELTDTPTTPGVKLTGARRVALEALQGLFSGTPVHIDEWRAAAFEAGISASADYEAKQKAFRRAVSGLLDAGLVRCTDDYYRPI